MGNFIDNKLIMLLALPFIAAGVLGFIVEFSLNFKPAFNAEEQNLLNFRPGDLKIKEQESILVEETLKSPIAMQKPEIELVEKITQGEEADLSLLDLLNPVKKSPFQEVSFILIKNQKEKMAIINDKVVNEGSRIGNAKILKIESGRVLIKEGKRVPRWIPLS